MKISFCWTEGLLFKTLKNIFINNLKLQGKNSYKNFLNLADRYQTNCRIQKKSLKNTYGLKNKIFFEAESTYITCEHQTFTLFFYQI